MSKQCCSIQGSYKDVDIIAKYTQKPKETKTTASFAKQISLVDISNQTRFHSYGNVIGEKEENQIGKDIKSFESL